MEIQAQSFVLKNGHTCTLRSAQPQDAAAMLAYLSDVFSQTEYLTCYPEELCFTLQQEEQHLLRVLENDSAAMVCAFIDGVLAGDASVQQVSERQRLCHRAELGIAVRSAYWGQGVATLLMDACLDAAWEMGFEQVELDVVSTNKAAIGLYEKFEFEPFGLHPRAFKYRDGRYADLILMQRIL